MYTMVILTILLYLLFITGPSHYATGFSDRGNKAGGVCLEDADVRITGRFQAVRNAVKDANMGRSNVAMDFLGEESTDCKIMRGRNSRSRKCTVSWMEKLPGALQQGLVQCIDVFMIVCIRCVDNRNVLNRFIFLRTSKYLT